MGGLSNFYTELNKGLGSASRIWEIYDRQYAIPYDSGLAPILKPKGNKNNNTNNIVIYKYTFNFNIVLNNY